MLVESKKSLKDRAIGALKESLRELELFILDKGRFGGILPM